MASRDELLRYARENRKNPTKSEQVMWRLLRKQQLADLKFRRQHVIEPYVADFACVSKLLIIEIDGGYHERTGDEDLARQHYLQSRGWRVLRFTSDEVESNAEAVLEGIVKELSLIMIFARKEYQPSGMFKKVTDCSTNLPGR